MKTLLCYLLLVFGAFSTLIPDKKATTKPAFLPESIDRLQWLQIGFTYSSDGFHLKDKVSQDVTEYGDKFYIHVVRDDGVFEDVVNKTDARIIGGFPPCMLTLDRLQSLKPVWCPAIDDVYYEPVFTYGAIREWEWFRSLPPRFEEF